MKEGKKENASKWWKNVKESKGSKEEWNKTKKEREERDDGAPCDAATTHAAARKQIRNVTYVSSVRYREAQRGTRVPSPGGLRRSCSLEGAICTASFHKPLQAKLHLFVRHRLKQKAE
jgi:hypothetical protein